MRTFTVVYKIKGVATCQVEAENEEEAKKMAEDAEISVEEWEVTGQPVEVIDLGENDS